MGSHNPILRGLTITMVINHLQVLEWPSKYPWSFPSWSFPWVWTRAFCPRAARKFAKKPTSYLIRLGQKFLPLMGWNTQKRAITGVIIVTMHYTRNPSKLPNNLHCLIPPKICNVMTPDEQQFARLLDAHWAFLCFQPSFCSYAMWSLRMSNKNTTKMINL